MTDIILTPLGPEFSDEYFAAFDDSVTRYQAAEPFESRAACAEYLSCLKEQNASGLALAFAIVSDGSFCGSIEAHGLWTPIPDIGIWLKTGCRGHGIAQEALRLLSEKLHALGFTRFFYETDARNEPSLRLVRKLRSRPVSSVPEPLVTEAGKQLRLIRFIVF